MILHEIVNQAVGEFEKARLSYGHGTDNAWDEVVVLVSHVLCLPPDATDEVLQRELTPEDEAAIRDLIRQRIERRVPAAYLCGRCFFAGLEFKVTADVLVPRSPFAELIAGEYSPWLLRAPGRILDLCTGSGCIGIATAHCFPGAVVDLTDISAAALAIARDNISRHQMHERVRALESDLFSALSGQQYDLIVCNPPYVDAADFAAMPDEYRAEPELGLVSGADGLDFTRRLLVQAREHLTEDGLLFVEVGNSWEALERAYPRVPFVWLEFERGGHGVFVLTAEELDRYRPDFLAGAGVAW